MTTIPQLVKKTLAYWIIWLIVAGQVTPYVILVGLLCSFTIAWVDLHRSPTPTRSFPWVHWLLYLPWLLWQVVKSGVHVTRLILHPKLPIDPQIISYKPRLRTSAGLVTLGNSITLSPGTITAEIAPDQLLIHSIDSESAKDIADGTMERRVSQVFERQVHGGG